MAELSKRVSLPQPKSVLYILLCVFLLTSLVPAPILAQQGTTTPGGTSIPGSGTGTTQAGETASSNATNSSGGSQENSSGDCSGTLGCLGSAVNHVKNGYISMYQGGYNYANPFNSQNGSSEFNESRSQFGQAGDDTAEAAKSIPGPWEMLMGLVDKGVSAFVNFVLDVIDGILWSLFALPAPGQAFDPGTWYTSGTPPLSNNSTGAVGNVSTNGSRNTTSNITAIQPMVKGGGVDRSVLPAGLDFDAWWAVVWKIYAGLAGLASIILFATAIFTFSSNSPTPRERNQRLRDVGIAILLVLFGPIVLPAALHFGNIVAAGLAPNAAELLNSPGDLLKIGEATGLAAIGVYFASTTMGVAFLISVIVSFAQWMLTFFVAATYIVWAPLYGSQNATLKAWSRMGFAALGTLIGLKIVQGLLFRVLWMLPLSWNEPAESIATLIVFPLGLYFIFYKLPKFGTKKAIPTFVSTVGGSGGGGGGGGGIEVDNSTRNFIHNIEPRTNNPGSSGGGSGGGGGGGGGSDGGGGGGGGAVPAEIVGNTERETVNGRARTRDSPPSVESGRPEEILVQDAGTNNPSKGTSPSSLPSSGGSGTSQQNPSDEQLAGMLDSEAGGSPDPQSPAGESEVPPLVQESVFENQGSDRVRPRDSQPMSPDPVSSEPIVVENAEESSSNTGEGSSDAVEATPENAPTYVESVDEGSPTSSGGESNGGRARSRSGSSGNIGRAEIESKPSNDSGEDSSSNNIPPAVNDFFSESGGDTYSNGESSSNSNSRTGGRARGRGGSDIGSAGGSSGSGNTSGGGGGGNGGSN